MEGLVGVLAEGFSSCFRSSASRRLMVASRSATAFSSDDGNSQSIWASVSALLPRPTAPKARTPLPARDAGHRATTDVAPGETECFDQRLPPVPGIRSAFSRSTILVRPTPSAAHSKMRRMTLASSGSTSIRYGAYLSIRRNGVIVGEVAVGIFSGGPDTPVQVAVKRFRPNELRQVTIADDFEEEDA